MKILLYNAFAVLLTFFLMTSCKEARKSIEETLHPKPQKKIASADSSTSSSSTVFSSSHVSSSSIVSSSIAAFSEAQEEGFESIFEDAATLDSIQQALRDMPGLKGKKLFMLNGLYFYDYRGGMISVDLQDPNNPENIDTYIYSNGEWQIQKPVRISGNGHFPIKLLLMSLDEVKFSTAKKVYDIAAEEAKKIEGAEPTRHVYFNQLKAVHVKEWYVMIRGSRRHYRITFDVHGNVRTKRSI